MTINTKFNIGDRVWVILNRHAVCKEITEITVTFTEKRNIVAYTVDSEYEPYFEAELFTTKEELLSSL